MGNILETEAVRTIKALGGWARKIPDTPAPKPSPIFDIVAAYRGIPLAIECKMTRGKYVVTKHGQNRAMNIFESTGGGVAYYMVNFRGKKRNSSGRCWFVPLRTWLCVFAVRVGGETRSVSQDHLESLFPEYEMVRITDDDRGSCWGFPSTHLLSPFFLGEITER